MGNIQHNISHFIDPSIYVDLTTGGAEATFARERDFLYTKTLLTHILCVSGPFLSTGEHLLHNFFLYFSYSIREEVAVLCPMILEYLFELLPGKTTYLFNFVYLPRVSFLYYSIDL